MTITGVYAHRKNSQWDSLKAAEWLWGLKNKEQAGQQSGRGVSKEDSGRG